MLGVIVWSHCLASVGGSPIPGFSWAYNYFWIILGVQLFPDREEKKRKKEKNIDMGLFVLI